MVSVLENLFIAFKENPQMFAVIFAIVGIFFYYYGYLYSSEKRRKADFKFRGGLVAYSLFWIPFLVVGLYFFASIRLTDVLLLLVLLWVMQLSLNYLKNMFAFSIELNRLKFIANVVLLAGPIIVFYYCFNNRMDILTLALLILLESSLRDHLIQSLKVYYDYNNLERVYTPSESILKNARIKIRESLDIVYGLALVVFSFLLFNFVTNPFMFIFGITLILIDSFYIVQVSGLKYDPAEHPLCDITLKNGETFEKVFFLREENGFIRFINKYNKWHLLNKDEIKIIESTIKIDLQANFQKEEAEFPLQNISKGGVI